LRGGSLARWAPGPRLKTVSTAVPWIGKSGCETARKETGEERGHGSWGKKKEKRKQEYFGRLQQEWRERKKQVTICVRATGASDGVSMAKKGP